MRFTLIALFMVLQIAFSSTVKAAPFDIKGINIDSSLEEIQSLLSEMGGICQIRSSEFGEARTVVDCRMANCLEPQQSQPDGKTTTYCKTYGDSTSLTVAGQNILTVHAAQKDGYDGISYIHLSLRRYSLRDEQITLESIIETFTNAFGEPDVGMQRGAESFPVWFWEQGDYQLKISQWLDKITMSADPKPLGLDLDDI